MPAAQVSLHQIITDQMVDLALTRTAQMFGLPKETVTKIVQVGLPMMAQMAESNPELFKRMYSAALTMLPEPVQDFYERMAADPAIRQSTMDDYKATFGSMLDAANREAARQAGITDGQARDVIAAALPAVNQALARANAARSEQVFAQQLKDLIQPGVGARGA
jgi:hypothetical protein